MKLTENISKKILIPAALWNISIGGCGLIFYDFSTSLFFQPSIVTHGLLEVVFFKLLMVAIIAFGVGYYIVSRDLYLNRAVIWLGLVCKMVLFFTFTYLYAAGSARIFAFLTVAGDCVWSLFFVLFLWQTRQGARISKDTQ